VRENADPNLTTALDVAGHSLTGRLDLAGCDAFVILALECKFTESDVVTAGSYATDLALAYLAELSSFRD
jgi:hypothetical protein